MKRLKILIVDRDEQLVDLLQVTLHQNSCVTDTATTAQQGWKQAEANSYDLILLDVGLPDLEGINFCRRLRATGNQVLVMLMIPKGHHHAPIVGLDAGADDYVVKPIDVHELAARIRALLRRRASAAVSVFEWGAIQLNAATQQVTYKGTTLTLSGKEYALLELFVRNPKRVYSQSAILHQLWSVDAELPGEETVRAHVKRLRQKLKTIGAVDFIETVYGVGYRLNQQIHQPDHTPATENHESAIMPISGGCSQLRDEPASSSVSLWQQQRSLLTQRIAVIEQAAQALLLNSLELDLQHQAQNGCTTLIKIFERLELRSGIELAQQLSQWFGASKTPLPSSVLLETVAQLKQSLETTLSPSQLSFMKAAQPEIKHRLLIVNDDQAWIDRFVLHAAEQGMHTAIATTAAAAQTAIRRARPDVILLDLSTIEHYDERSQLLHHSPKLPILVFVEDHAKLQRGAIAQAHGRSFLSKQTSPPQVLATVRQILEPEQTADAKIMVLDDDLLTLRLLKGLLQPWGLQVLTLDNPLQIWQQLEQYNPELLVLDIKMPEVDGIDLCQQLRNDSRWAWLPILVLTSQTDATTIQQVFSAGADDYVSKPVVPPELITRIFNRLERSRLLRRQTEIDALTGLPNQVRATQILEQQLQVAREQHQPFCLAVLEIDRWTTLRRQYGTALGDEMVRQVAQILRQSFRPEDLVSRWTGTEFVIGWLGLTVEDSQQWLIKVSDQLNAMQWTSSKGQTIRITVNVGVQQYSQQCSELSALYEEAACLLS